MTRYEFLKSIGFTGGALMAVLTSCVNEDDTYVPALTIDPNAAATIPPGTVIPSNGTDPSTITNPLLKLDLTTTTNVKLKTVGGYVVQSGIVVAQVSTGVYVAVTQTCSHEPKKAIIYSGNEFYCTKHGARFDLNGKGKNSLGSGGIAVYKVATDGKTLVVYK